MVKWSMAEKSNKYIVIWLTLCCAVVIITTVIGGYTRLSGAGLAITEWKPVTGILPPLTYKSLVAEFNKYKLIPQYEQINQDITLEAFKKLYMTEYIHRNAARTVFVIFLLPLCYFIQLKALNRRQLIISCASVLIILLQGLVGWYMVKSGLSVKTEVSHYRLTVHFMLSTSLLLITFLNLLYTLYQDKIIKDKCNVQLTSAIGIMTALTLIQIILGCLTAGLKAGYVSNTFPLMEGVLWPTELFNTKSFFANDPRVIHFLHRLTGIIIIIIAFPVLRHSRYTCQAAAIRMIKIMISIQFALGVITIVRNMPTVTAVAHQLSSLLLLCALIYGLFVAYHDIT